MTSSATIDAVVSCKSDELSGMACRRHSESLIMKINILKTV